MKKIITTLFVVLFVCGSFAGCNNNISSDENSNNNEISSSQEENSQNYNSEISATDDDMFTDRDVSADYDEGNAVTIKLNGISATSSSDSVKISGSTITITQAATYIVSGELTDGMIIINAEDTAKLQIILKGADITSKTSAALYISQADKVFLTLADGTKNTLANGGSFEAIDDNNIDAALFSKQDLTLNGTGSLTVTSPAGHGIVCKDDLVFTGGSYTVNSASHGIDANDSIRIDDADFTVDAGKDAFHCENTDDSAKGYIYISSGNIKAEAEGDGIAASSYIQVDDGTIDLLVGGGAVNGTKASSGSYGGFMGGGRGGMHSGEYNISTSGEDTVSMKGIKAANGLLFLNGNIVIDSADDAIHSDTSVAINGGNFTIASGDDAIHAEDELTITAGVIEISESYEGLEALDIAIKGGDIKLAADDDGLNAAGGTDSSGTTGGRDGMFGGGKGGFGGMGGMSSGNGSIVISGGNLYINASGDGIDANGTLEINGGYTVVVGPTQGDTATLDYDKSAVISGGTFIGTGASNMAQTFSDSEQGVVAVSVGSQKAGTQIALYDTDGNVIITHYPELDFSVLILSSPEIEKGETYKIEVGSESAEFDAN